LGSLLGSLLVAIPLMAILLVRVIGHI
jgi:hypothetical protein